VIEQRLRRAWQDAPVRAVVQRVSEARVVVDGDTVGALDRPGLVVLVGLRIPTRPAMRG